MNWDATEVWGKYPFVFFTALLMSSVLSLLWRRVAPYGGFVDRPGERRIHSDPVPTAGGIALIAGFHVACAAIFFVPWHPFSGQLSLSWWLGFGIVSCCVAAVGIADDRLRLKPGIKLAGQVVVGGVAYAQGMRIGNVFGAPLPEMADMVATVVWFLVLMNAFNLIDGLDGLAAGLGVVASLGVGVSLLFRNHPNDVLICLALAGACVGFLRYNFHPAKLFMGDTGSMFLGCAIACIALGTSSKGTAMVSIMAPILAAGVPILDASMAVWRRSVRSFLRTEEKRGLSLWGLAQGDDEHLHHRLLRRGLSQRQVAVILYGFGVLLAVIGVVSSAYQEYRLGVLMLAFVIGVYVVVRHLAWIELWDSGTAILAGLRRGRPKSLALILYPVMDVTAMAVALSVALALATGGESGRSLKQEWIRAAPWAVGFPFILLVLSRSYSRVWSRARISEYVLTGAAVVGGILLWLAAALVFCDHPTRVCTTTAFLLIGMSVPAVVGSRAFVRVLRDIMAWKSRLAAGRGGARRVLLVGAGAECQLFLTEASLLYDPEKGIHVVGIVDEDIGLRGRWVHGYRVLGTLDSLSAIMSATGAEEIVIVTRLDPDSKVKLLCVAAGQGAVVREWSTRLDTLRSGS